MSDTESTSSSLSSLSSLPDRTRPPPARVGSSHDDTDVSSGSGSASPARRQFNRRIDTSTDATDISAADPYDAVVQAQPTPAAAAAAAPAPHGRAGDGTESSSLSSLGSEVGAPPVDLGVPVPAAMSATDAHSSRMDHVQPQAQEPARPVDQSFDEAAGGTRTPEPESAPSRSGSSSSSDDSSETSELKWEEASRSASKSTRTPVDAPASAASQTSELDIALVDPHVGIPAAEPPAHVDPTAQPDEPKAPATVEHAAPSSSTASDVPAVPPALATPKRGDAATAEDDSSSLTSLEEDAPAGTHLSPTDNVLHAKASDGAMRRQPSCASMLTISSVSQDVPVGRRAADEAKMLIAAQGAARMVPAVRSPPDHAVPPMGIGEANARAARAQQHLVTPLSPPQESRDESLLSDLSSDDGTHVTASPLSTRVQAPPPPQQQQQHASPGKAPSHKWSLSPLTDHEQRHTPPGSHITSPSQISLSEERVGQAGVDGTATASEPAVHAPPPELPPSSFDAVDEVPAGRGAEARDEPGREVSEGRNEDDASTEDTADSFLSIERALAMPGAGSSPTRQMIQDEFATHDPQTEGSATHTGVGTVRTPAAEAETDAEIARLEGELVVVGMVPVVGDRDGTADAGGALHETAVDADISGVADFRSELAPRESSPMEDTKRWGAQPLRPSFEGGETANGMFAAAATANADAARETDMVGLLLHDVAGGAPDAEPIAAPAPAEPEQVEDEVMMAPAAAPAAENAGAKYVDSHSPADDDVAARDTGLVARLNRGVERLGRVREVVERRMRKDWGAECQRAAQMQTEAGELLRQLYLMPQPRGGQGGEMLVGSAEALLQNIGGLEASAEAEDTLTRDDLCKKIARLEARLEKEQRHHLRLETENRMIRASHGKGGGEKAAQTVVIDVQTDDATHKQLHKTLLAVARERDALTDKIAQMEKEKGVTDAMLTASEARVREVEDENERLRGEVRSTETRANCVAQELPELRAELATAKRKIVHLNAENRALALESSVDDILERHYQKTGGDAPSKLVAADQGARFQVEQLEGEVAEVRKQLNAALSELDAAQEENRKLQSEVFNTKQRLQETEDEIDAIQKHEAEAAASNSKAEEADQRAAYFEGEWQKEQAKTQKLERKVEAVEGLKAAAERARGKEEKEKQDLRKLMAKQQRAHDAAIQSLLDKATDDKATRDAVAAAQNLVLEEEIADLKLKLEQRDEEMESLKLAVAAADTERERVEKAAALADAAAIEQRSELLAKHSAVAEELGRLQAAKEFATSTGTQVGGRENYVNMSAQTSLPTVNYEAKYHEMCKVQAALTKSLNAAEKRLEAAEEQNREDMHSHARERALLTAVAKAQEAQLQEDLKQEAERNWELKRKLAMKPPHTYGYTPSHTQSTTPVREVHTTPLSIPPASGPTKTGTGTPRASPLRRSPTPAQTSTSAGDPQPQRDRPRATQPPGAATSDVDTDAPPAQTKLTCGLSAARAAKAELHSCGRPRSPLTVDVLAHGHPPPHEEAAELPAGSPPPSAKAVSEQTQAPAESDAAHRSTSANPPPDAAVEELAEERPAAHAHSASADAEVQTTSAGGRGDGVDRAVGRAKVAVSRQRTSSTGRSGGRGRVSLPVNGGAVASKVRSQSQAARPRTADAGASPQREAALLQHFSHNTAYVKDMQRRLSRLKLQQEIVRAEEPKGAVTRSASAPPTRLRSRSPAERRDTGTPHAKDRPATSRAANTVSAGAGATRGPSGPTADDALAKPRASGASLLSQPTQAAKPAPSKPRSTSTSPPPMGSYDSPQQTMGSVDELSFASNPPLPVALMRPGGGQGQARAAAVDKRADTRETTGYASTKGAAAATAPVEACPPKPAARRAPVFPAASLPLLTAVRDALVKFHGSVGQVLWKFPSEDVTTEQLRCVLMPCGLAHLTPQYAGVLRSGPDGRVTKQALKDALSAGGRHRVSGTVATSTYSAMAKKKEAPAAQPSQAARQQPPGLLTSREFVQLEIALKRITADPTRKGTPLTASDVLEKCSGMDKATRLEYHRWLRSTFVNRKSPGVSPQRAAVGS